MASEFRFTVQLNTSGFRSRFAQVLGVTNGDVPATPADSVARPKKRLKYRDVVEAEERFAAVVEAVRHFERFAQLIGDVRLGL